MKSEETGLNLLVVDDDQVDLLLMKRAFAETNDGCHITTACDGREALDVLRSEGTGVDAPKTDVILLDLNMPGMSGHQFLEARRQDDALGRIPVVVVTTSDAKEDLLKSYRLGAAGYVIKPVGFEEFRHAIGHLYDYWTTCALPG